MSESNGAFAIRRARASDAAELARMRAASSYERGGFDAERRDAYARVCEMFFTRELADPASFVRSWVATVDGAVVGGASLAIWATLPRADSLMPDGRDGRVRDVFVEPQQRGRGIARALMAAVIETAKAENVDRLTLGASKMGRPLYLKIGFVPKLDEMTYEG